MSDAGNAGALYGLGVLNLADLNSETDETITPSMTRTRERDGQLWWGMNFGLGVRGNLSDNLGIGCEFGWAFSASTDDGDTSGEADDTSVFVHGIWAALVFEASVGT